MAISYHIQEADLTASAAAIRGLWVTNLLGHDEDSARTKLSLGYADNPAGTGLALLLYPEGEASPVGVQGLHPRTFHFGERRLRAVGLADYAVDAQHRSLGPALQLMRHGTQVSQARFDLTYGLPNQKAAAVLARAGLRRIGTIRRFAKPLRSRQQLAQRIPAPLAAVLAPMFDLMLRLDDARRSLQNGPRLECIETPWSQANIDNLWAHRPAMLLLSERSAGMLRWRFGRPERGDWRLSVAREGTAERGYVVWRFKDDYIEVGDFFSDAPDELTTPLMLAFARQARRAGANAISVTFFGHEAVALAIRRSGMSLRPQQAPVFKLPGADAALDDPERWYLTSFDNDAD